MQYVNCFAPKTPIIYETMDPNLQWSRFRSTLGSNYLPLVTACYEWKRTQNIHLLKKSTVKEAVEHESFKKISEQLMKNNRRSRVQEFLLKLVDGPFPLKFLVAYVYLEGSIPKRV